MTTKISREDRSVPFIVSTKGHNRGTIRMIHVQTAKDSAAQTRTSLCGRTLPLGNWTLVNSTEFRGQMMVCEACERKG